MSPMSKRVIPFFFSVVVLRNRITACSVSSKLFGQIVLHRLMVVIRDSPLTRRRRRRGRRRRRRRRKEGEEKKKKKKEEEEEEEVDRRIHSNFKRSVQLKTPQGWKL